VTQAADAAGHSRATLPAMTEPSRQLYAVYLGGDPAPGRIGEDHEVVFVIAEDVKAARQKAREKWTGDDPKPHVDMVQELDIVDGYSVLLAPTDKAPTATADSTYEPTP
jgi:Domain of Unknown Function (DUF1543)